MCTKLGETQSIRNFEVSIWLIFVLMNRRRVLVEELYCRAGWGNGYKTVISSAENDLVLGPLRIQSGEHDLDGSWDILSP